MMRMTEVIGSIGNPPFHVVREHIQFTLSIGGFAQEIKRKITRRKAAALRRFWLKLIPE
jgi:hypothetical protein